jgi:hypothetical protein
MGQLELEFVFFLESLAPGVELPGADVGFDRIVARQPRRALPPPTHQPRAAGRQARRAAALGRPDIRCPVGTPAEADVLNAALAPLGNFMRGF